MPAKTIVISTVFAAGLATVLWAQSETDGGEQPRVDTGMHGAAAGAPAPDPESVVLPETLSGPSYFGLMAFEKNCASCHGTNGAGGTGEGPPLIHPIYEPNHHPDAAFQRAAMTGVQSHHWNFGDMAPVDGIDAKTVALITTFIREVQRANGIE